MKTVIRSLLSKFNLEVRRIDPTANKRQSQMEAALERYRLLDDRISTVVDVGAARGEWSVSAQKIWPSASFLLFEPLKEQAELLDRLAVTNKSFQIVHAAAGKERGEVKLFVTNDLDGSSVIQDSQQEGRTISVVSIQEEVKARGLHGPFIIKLDTHGFEVPILEGCREILDDTSLLIIECYGFRIAKNSLLFWEMCTRMDSLGFRVLDVIEIMRRPKDGAFWQCDIFFINKDRAIFGSNSYN